VEWDRLEALRAAGVGQKAASLIAGSHRVAGLLRAFRERHALLGESRPEQPDGLGPDAMQREQILRPVVRQIGKPRDASCGKRPRCRSTDLRQGSVVRHRLSISRQHRRGYDVAHPGNSSARTVYRQGVPIAFIDWDAIRPSHPLVEFGNAAWHFVPLGDNAYFDESGFPSPPDLAERLALFAREYGVTDRSEAAWALHQAKQRSVEATKYWPISPAEGAAALRLIANQLEWLHDNVEGLVSKLS
jgi:hypothetical protein